MPSTNICSCTCFILTINLEIFIIHLKSKKIKILIPNFPDLAFKAATLQSSTAESTEIDEDVVVRQKTEGYI